MNFLPSVAKQQQATRRCILCVHPDAEHRTDHAMHRTNGSFFVSSAYKFAALCLVLALFAAHKQQFFLNLLCHRQEESRARKKVSRRDGTQIALHVKQQIA